MTTTPVSTGRSALSAKVAEEIRAVMARKGITSGGLARQLGVSDAWTSRRISMRGDGEIDLGDLERIADVLGVTVVDLLPAAMVRPNNR
ncbi:helix-turn-helix domain-containing protein [Micromonospora aurantiaca (nom. illeg.)]|uniref:Helix-turn-helix transcriptional regulator n=1 Tax=Micromonospora aurantiaca (nom. illeg.) TaxID=47850 RepID=A0A6N3JV26_9ACTN|nr:helix-turn-helix transcriptional regulator [Micromonospora aurantiaca]AXH88756.1 XRE family transcriptional regulator [Micromonospora aurantiaca]KAB1119059.1 helix-turn-helix transcriptional regulator [Micromonospora aurantiaca]MBC9005272.1 helix-turn-helix transcriptional regulator [Micromonospora aurantiaca]